MKKLSFNVLETDIKIPINKIEFVKQDIPLEISIDFLPASDLWG